jgi:hypothetical protein
MLDQFLVRYPPADWQLAVKWGYQAPAEPSPSSNAAKVPMRQAARMNAGAPLPPRNGKLQSIDTMPGYVRTPEMIAHIDKMKTEWQTT